MESDILVGFTVRQQIRFFTMLESLREVLDDPASAVLGALMAAQSPFTTDLGPEWVGHYGAKALTTICSEEQLTTIREFLRANDEG